MTRQYSHLPPVAADRTAGQSHLARTSIALGEDIEIKARGATGGSAGNAGAEPRKQSKTLAQRAQKKIKPQSTRATHHLEPPDCPPVEGLLSPASCRSAAHHRDHAHQP